MAEALAWDSGSTRIVIQLGVELDALHTTVCAGRIAEAVPDRAYNSQDAAVRQSETLRRGPQP